MFTTCICLQQLKIYRLDGNRVVSICTPNFPKSGRGITKENCGRKLVACHLYEVNTVTFVVSMASYEKCGLSLQQPSHTVVCINALEIEHEIEKTLSQDLLRFLKKTNR